MSNWACCNGVLSAYICADSETLLIEKKKHLENILNESPKIYGSEGCVEFAILRHLWHGNAFSFYIGFSSGYGLRDSNKINVLRELSDAIEYIESKDIEVDILSLNI